MSLPWKGRPSEMVGYRLKKAPKIWLETHPQAHAWRETTEAEGDMGRMLEQANVFMLNGLPEYNYDNIMDEVVKCELKFFKMHKPTYPRRNPRSFEDLCTKIQVEQAYRLNNDIVHSKLRFVYEYEKARNAADVKQLKKTVEKLSEKKASMKVVKAKKVTWRRRWCRR
jgi:hypothetical protein